MLNSSFFFSNPAISLGQVYGQVLEIFLAERQTFMALSGLQVACFIPFTILMAVILAAMFDAEGAALIGAIVSIDPTRALSNFNNYNPSDDITTENKDYSTNFKGDDAIDFTAMIHQLLSREELFFSLLFLGLLFMGLAILITSTFQGAMIRAVAEVHAGLRPSWLTCLKFGWKNMCKLTCFGFLIMLAYFTAFMISAVGVLAAIYKTTSSSFPDYLFLFFFVYFEIISIAGAAMIAGPSMVVVEGKSVVEAMKSSWHLCKTHICFIYCSFFGFNLLTLVLGLITSIFSGSATVPILNNFIIAPLNLIIGTVLYMALRIRKDGLTQADLVQELSDESSFEMSNAHKYQQASAIDDYDDDSFEKKSFAVAVGKSIV